jgi:hypothetical protein
MPAAFNRGVRFRLALALAVFAAVCFALPPALLAFGHSENLLHCLAHADGVGHDMSMDIGNAHKAAQQDSSDHNDHTLPATAHHSSCCGLSCMSALPADINQNLPTVVAGPVRALPAEPHLLSPAPKQLDRPPISLSLL